VSRLLTGVLEEREGRMVEGESSRDGAMVRMGPGPTPGTPPTPQFVQEVRRYVPGKKLCDRDSAGAYRSGRQWSGDGVFLSIPQFYLLSFVR